MSHNSPKGNFASHFARKFSPAIPKFLTSCKFSDWGPPYTITDPLKAYTEYSKVVKAFRCSVSLILYQIGLDVDSMTILPDSLYYEYVYGSRLAALGSATDCMSSKISCPKGEFNIDLGGTPFLLNVDASAWSTNGTATKQITFGEGGKTVHGVCGGGGCHGLTLCLLHLSLIGRRGLLYFSY